jgi:hypothetical protein
MVRRVVSAVVGLAVLAGIGVAAGYAVGENRVEETATFATPVAVPAAKPSFPVNVYDVQPDPTTDPLETGVPLQETKFRSGGFKLRAPVPTGWQRVELPGGNQWNFTVATNPTNTYLLRISILAADRRATRVEAIARLAALRSAETDGNSENLIVEEESDTGFTATYIDSGGFQRVSIERFETVPGNESAYFSVALSGREVDREGMADLVDRVVAGAYVP